MNRPTWDAYFLDIAAVVATRSSCVKRKVGAVLVSEDRAILATGYNGPPRGAPHRDEHTCVRIGIPSGERADVVCCAHAEANAIAQAARHGVPVKGSTLYCTTSPCAWCARSIVNAGVVRVVREGDYNDPVTLGVFAESGVHVVALTRVTTTVTEASHADLCAEGSRYESETGANAADHPGDCAPKNRIEAAIAKGREDRAKLKAVGWQHGIAAGPGDIDSDGDGKTANDHHREKYGIPKRIRPTYCHGQCVNAPEGEPPLQRTFNMVCAGCIREMGRAQLIAAVEAFERVTSIDELEQEIAKAPKEMAAALVRLRAAVFFGSQKAEKIPAMASARKDPVRLALAAVLERNGGDPVTLMLDDAPVEAFHTEIQELIGAHEARARTTDTADTVKRHAAALRFLRAPQGMDLVAAAERAGLAVDLVRSARLTPSCDPEDLAESIKAVCSEIQKHAPWNGSSRCEAPFPATVARYVIQYDEAVFVWLDEVGRPGGAETTLEQALAAVSQYAKELNTEGPRRGPPMHVGAVKRLCDTFHVPSPNDPEAMESKCARFMVDDARDEVRIQQEKIQARNAELDAVHADLGSAQQELIDSRERRESLQAQMAEVGKLNDALGVIDIAQIEPMIDALTEANGKLSAEIQAVRNERDQWAANAHKSERDLSTQIARADQAQRQASSLLKAMVRIERAFTEEGNHNAASYVEACREQALRESE